jgi:hypothetical protein
MKELAAEAVMPRISDVLVEAIDCPPGSDQGYLAMYVERSERRPHQCEFGRKAYYRRAGSSSRRMELFEIEDAFRRMAAPQLELSSQLHAGSQFRGTKPETNEVIIEFSLSNASGVSATYPYIFVDGPKFATDFVQPPGVIGRQEGGRWCFEAGVGVAIHPGVCRPICRLRRSIEVTPGATGRGVFVSRLAASTGPLRILYGCRDTRLREEMLIIKPEQWVAMIDNATLQN